MMKTHLKKCALAVGALALPVLAMAQEAPSTPAESIAAGADTASAVFTAFAAVAVAAFIFRMVMKFARKGS